MKSSTATELVRNESTVLVNKDVRCLKCGKLLCRIRYHFSTNVPSLTLAGVHDIFDAKVSVETKCPRCKEEDFNITSV